MEYLKFNANAKINWSLNVINRRPDGYHNIDMVLQSIDLCDTITVSRISKGIELSVDGMNALPTDSRNIAYRAARLMQDSFNIGGVRIHIEKRIPAQAGMGGGSADASGVLLAIDRLFSLDNNFESLSKLARALGADMPFMLRGGLARALGIGEELTFFDNSPTYHLVGACAPTGASTAEIYRLFKTSRPHAQADNEALINALLNRNYPIISANMINALEKVTSRLIPEIDAYKQILTATLPVKAIMTGSGSAVYALYKSPEEARKAYLLLKDKLNHCFICQTTGRSFNVIEQY